MGLVQADQSDVLYKQGADALSAGQYDIAVKAFDQIISGYPLSPHIDDVRLRDGFAYMHLEKYPEAVDRLSKETLPAANAAYRGTALFYTGLAQFSQGLKLIDPDKVKGKAAFNDAVTAFSTLIDLITTAPTPDNKDYLEEAIYYRALSYFEREDYNNSEKDLLRLIQQFPSSLLRPDYYLRLGSLYAVETNLAVGDKKSTDVIKALAAKALNAFDQVSNDPNALVQANEAEMNKAEILYLIAPLDSGDEGYKKALMAYRQVRRKDDLIPLQQNRLDELKKNSANALVNSGASLANANSRLIDREANRLETLKDPKTPDPIIQALIRMAECYISMKQPDEARTILHRLTTHATLTADQQQEVDFQLLYSYAQGGQTDKADKALDDYLAKHSGDPQADSISYQIAAKLLSPEKADYEGALKQAQRSLKDFPKGRLAADAVGLEADALTKLNRLDEADKIVNDFLKSNPTSPAANGMLLSRAHNKAARKDFAGALLDYQKVRDNPQAGDLQPIAAAGYIQTLLSLCQTNPPAKQPDDVIKESKDFAAKYPKSKALPSVLLFGALAKDMKHDPGAVTDLQDLAKTYPKDEVAPFALISIVHIYQAAKNVPAMIQAATDLRTTYPTNYGLIKDAADVVSKASLDAKNFDQAIAQYQPLIDVPDATVAASSRNAIGAIWLAAAQNLGAYQSMQLDERAKAETTLSNSEQAYLGTLKTFPDQLDAVGDAFQGLTDALTRRRSWGVLTDATMEGYLGKLTAALTAPDMQTRVELAKAGLVFVYKKPQKQYPAALDRFKKAISANPGLALTRQEANQYGEMLVAARDYPAALQVYSDLLSHASANDIPALVDGNYGLGATYLAQGDVATAAKYFAAMKAVDTKQAAIWHPHILDANFGLALAAEQAGDPKGEAKQAYGVLMQAPGTGSAIYNIQAKAILGYGRLLEKAGHGLKPAPEGPNETALYYYLKVPTQFGNSVPALSAEGLFDAGQLYEKAGDKVNAKKQYTDLITNYGQVAPDWAAKAQAALTKLGP